MKKKENNEKEYYSIDLKHIFKSIWKRAWLVILSGLVAAGIGFSVSSFLITPKYSSSIMLYVNNSSFSLGNTSFSISSSEITAAQSLVKTYAEILNNRTTLTRVIEKSGVDYTYEQLSKMVVATTANETEIMRVTVTADDPKVASKIANYIAEVLPVRIAEIIDGASMEVVDYAVPNKNKVEPSVTTYTAVGLFLGVLACCLILAVVAMLDDTIHDEEYVLNTYDYPILAKIPDLVNSGGKQYSYYYQKKNKTQD